MFLDGVAAVCPASLLNPRLDDRFGLGNVYLKTGKHALAEYHFRKALELNPANATLACCVGTVLEKLGRREEALVLYDHAKAVAPESALARFKRVRLLVRLKRHEVRSPLSTHCFRACK